MSLTTVDQPEEIFQQAVDTFELLGSAPRLRIVWELSRAERDVSSLAAQLGKSLAVVSRHLTKLRLAGLVSVRTQGRYQVYTVEDAWVIEIVHRMMENLVRRRDEDDGDHGADPPRQL
ncbi:ArsR/SmtB family transcription factor [Streptacidiphilus sp. EB129]|uniref:ArsR/SmtB family transcription factor n=1 Tax=Streptacidiphilus sp. EB129 TaxID=3156262 RepID=UPI0035147E01